MEKLHCCGKFDPREPDNDTTEQGGGGANETVHEVSLYFSSSSACSGIDAAARTRLEIQK